MTHASIEKIFQTAVRLQEKNQPWHFHILTPDCRLNNSTQYALVLETKDQLLVNYAEKPYLEIGEQLVRLLHGNTVMSKNLEALPPPSPSVQPILARARELTKQGQFWHHHLLFPHCQYNTHPGQWVLIFEDPRSREILESVTDQEPKADLKHVETLFYSQTHHE